MNETTFLNIYYFFDTSCQRIIIFEEVFYYGTIHTAVKRVASKYLGEDYDIRKQEVTKVNDTKLTALVLTEKGSNIGATIYLDEYYKYYECGQLQTIADNIISNLQTQEKPVVPDDIISDYKNFDSVALK